MTIIIDTNVILAALIQQGIVRQIILEHPDTFLTPESCLDEVWEHRLVWNRHGRSDAVLRSIVDSLVEDFIVVVSERVYSRKLVEATELIGDPDDIPVVALALAVDNRGIWTFNTRDFSGRRLRERVRILTTAEVRRELSPDG